METPKKTGFWTQHVDPNSGTPSYILVAFIQLTDAYSLRKSLPNSVQRTYYFNMALGRSYWELPVELQAQVKKPTLDALREWDPDTAERKYGTTNQHADEELRRKREEALAKSRTETVEAQAASTKLSLEERMALAAQKRKKVEVQSSSRVASTSSNAEGSNEYLELVRQLQQNGDGGEASGGKWLVR